MLACHTIVVQRLVRHDAEVGPIFALAVGTAGGASFEGLVEAIDPFGGDRPLVPARSATHAATAA